MLKLVVIYLLNKLALCYIKVSYALKLLRENILLLIMKILDIDLNVTNIKCMQKYRTLSPDSVDTFNSKIRHNLIKV